MKRFIMLAAGVALSAAAYSQGGEIDWRADLDFLASELPAKQQHAHSRRGGGFGDWSINGFG